MAGGGVGEAMLIGAAVGATAGGAGAAIQGGDPLQGAITGGVLGAAGGGLGAGFGAAGGASTGAAGGASTGAATGATTVGAGTTAAGTTAGLGGSAGTGLTSTFTPATAANLGANVSGVGAGSGTLGSSGFGLTASSGLPTTASSIYGTGAGAGGVGGIAAPTATTGGASGLGIAQGSALPAGGFSATGTIPTTTAGPGNFTGYAPQLSNKALGITAGGSALAGAMGAEQNQFGTPPEEEYSGPLSKFKYDPDKFTASEPTYAPGSVYRPTYAAEGGIMQAFQADGSVDDESGMDEARGITQGNLQKGLFGRGYAPGGMVDPSIGMAAQQQSSQQSMGSQGIDSLMGNKKRMLTKEQMDAVALQGMSKEAMQDVYGQMAAQGLAKGGQLGGYSDGGRMLKGPGDGMSDDIPGVIGNKQPARLADGEFVVPADVVSHLGNGSTDAGAKQLYAMMNRVRKARTGNSKQGKQIKPAKYMVA
jgi:hypothetical protein